MRLHDLGSDRPTIRYAHNGREQTLECDVVAGCDGFHGVSRASIPAGVLTEYERVYPFGWLGILAAGRSVDGGADLRLQRARLRAAQPPLTEDQPPLHPGSGRRGHRGRGRTTGSGPSCTRGSRRDDGWTCRRGRSSRRASHRFRSFVAEPMHFGRLFLAGDAAHIVPPTGAKGLNLAVADVTSARARRSQTSTRPAARPARRVLRHVPSARLAGAALHAGR